MAIKEPEAALIVGQEVRDMPDEVLAAEVEEAGAEDFQVQELTNQNS